MKSIRIYRVAAILLFAVLVAAVPQLAQAATSAGVPIGNSAIVSYQVGSVLQPVITAPTVTFVVDRLVTFAVTDKTNLTTSPSYTYQAIQYIVTNTSNTAMRFALSPHSRASNTWSLTAPKIYLDVNNTGVYGSTDTLYVNAGTFGDVASGATLTVLIVGDIPAGLTTGQIAIYDLIATAVDAGTLTTTVATGAGVTKSSGVGNLMTLLTVFGDPAGSASADGLDAARDGINSASGTYTITAAGLTVSKTAAVYSDPQSGTGYAANPKAIPGAVVTYTITITNAAGGAAASNVSITDSLASIAGYATFRTAFDESASGGTNCGANKGVFITGGGVGTACQTTNVAGDDNADYGVTTASTVTVTGLNIAAGATATIKFQVTIL